MFKTSRSRADSLLYMTHHSTPDNTETAAQAKATRPKATSPKVWPSLSYHDAPRAIDFLVEGLGFVTSGSTSMRTTRPPWSTRSCCGRVAVA